MTVTALDLRVNLKKLVSLSQRFRTLTHSIGPSCVPRALRSSGMSVNLEVGLRRWKRRTKSSSFGSRCVRRPCVRRPAIGQADLREGRGREGVQVNEARWLLKR